MNIINSKTRITTNDINKIVNELNQKVKTIDDITPDKDGNIDLGNEYLSVSGGRMNGSIDLYIGNEYLGHIIALNDDTSGKSILFDTFEENNSGSFLRLHKGTDTKNPGEFCLAARNAQNTIYKELRGTVDGYLSWDNVSIVRSVNNILADENGNVSIYSISAQNVSVPTNLTRTMSNNQEWTLPSGGTWKYFYVDNNSTSQYYNGVVPGGTTFTGNSLSGMAIRIS